MPHFDSNGNVKTYEDWIKDIEDLKEQNSLDFQDNRNLRKEIEKLEEQLKDKSKLNDLKMKKIESDYAKLKRVIIDENVSVTLNNKIDTSKKELNQKIETNRTEVNSKLSEVNEQLETIALNLENFEGNNDTQKLNNALEYIKTLNKPVRLEIPPRIYEVSGKFELISNIEITSKGAVIKLANNSYNNTNIGVASIFESRNKRLENVKISGITFDGNKNNQKINGGGGGTYPGTENIWEWSHAIQIHSVDNIDIKNCIFKNFQGDGINLGTSNRFDGLVKIPCKNIKIEDCIFENIYREGIGIFQTEDAILRNLKFKNTTTGNLNLYTDNFYVACIDIENHHGNDINKNITIENIIIDSSDVIVGVNAMAPSTTRPEEEFTIDKINNRGNITLKNIKSTNAFFVIRGHSNINIEDVNGEITKTNSYFDNISSFIYCQPNDNFPNNTHKNFKIKNIDFEGNNNSKYGVLMYGQELLNIDSVTISNVKQHGIRLVNCGVPHISKSYLFNTGDGVFSDTAGISVEDDCYRFMIHDVLISDKRDMPLVEYGIRFKGYCSEKGVCTGNIIKNMKTKPMTESNIQLNYHAIYNNLLGDEFVKNDKINIANRFSITLDFGTITSKSYKKLDIPCPQIKKGDNIILNSRYGLSAKVITECFSYQDGTLTVLAYNIDTTEVTLSTDFFVTLIR